VVIASRMKVKTNLSDNQGLVFKFFQPQHSGNDFFLIQQEGSTPTDYIRINKRLFTNKQNQEKKRKLQAVEPILHIVYTSFFRSTNDQFKLPFEFIPAILH
jgi:hypothetical protein